MERRNFLLLEPPSGPTIELSCERLYMKYVDARMQGTEAALLGRLRARVRRAGGIRLRDAIWLQRGDFRQAIMPILDEVRARSGAVEIV